MAWLKRWIVLFGIYTRKATDVYAQIKRLNMINFLNICQNQYNYPNGFVLHIPKLGLPYVLVLKSMSRCLGQFKIYEWIYISFSYTYNTFLSYRQLVIKLDISNFKSNFEIYFRLLTIWDTPVFFSKPRNSKTVSI